MPSISELLPLIAGAAEGPIGEAVASGVTGAIEGGVGKVASAVVDPLANMAVQGINGVMPQQQQQQQPAPTIDPMLSAILQRNDLSQYPNIQRAQQEPGGIALLHQMFGSLNGQPLHPEYNDNVQTVDPKELLTRQGGDGYTSNQYL